MLSTWDRYNLGHSSTTEVRNEYITRESKGRGTGKLSRERQVLYSLFRRASGGGRGSPLLGRRTPPPPAVPAPGRTEAPAAAAPHPPVAGETHLGPRAGAPGAQQRGPSAPGGRGAQRRPRGPCPAIALAVAGSDARNRLPTLSPDPFQNLKHPPRVPAVAFPLILGRGLPPRPESPAPPEARTLQASARPLGALALRLGGAGAAATVAGGALGPARVDAGASPAAPGLGSAWAGTRPQGRPRTARLSRRRETPG